MAKILVADDEHAICAAFEAILTQAGHETIVAHNAGQAIDAVSREQPDAVFLDVQLPDMNGLIALQEIRATAPDLPIIIMTAHGTVQTAMQAIKSGAFDYLGKPLDLQQIRSVLNRALHSPSRDSDQPPIEANDEPLVGTSAVMQEIYKMMSLLAGNDLTVLITGESGVGKELVARGIHANSNRADAPFTAVNCAAIPEQLLESELFGHEKGAFSGAHAQRIGRFEAAGHGTLFLDEVFELPLHLQGKLLRALQEKSFERVGSVDPQPLEARIVAATNQSLNVIDNTIRDDLYYRLNLVNVNIPPLRERTEDIPALARHFLGQANAELGKSIVDLDSKALEALTAHHWPGNVRELDHTIKRSALVARGTLLSTHDISFDTTSAATKTKPMQNDFEAALRTALHTKIADMERHPSEAKTSVFHELVSKAERVLIDEALHITQQNQVAASQLLGVNRTTLRNKLPNE